jgi:hypothetical protein
VSKQGKEAVATVCVVPCAPAGPERITKLASAAPTTVIVLFMIDSPRLISCTRSDGVSTSDISHLAISVTLLTAGV